MMLTVIFNCSKLMLITTDQCYDFNFEFDTKEKLDKGWYNYIVLEVYPSPCDGDRERVPNSQTREWTTIFPRNTPTSFHKTVILYFFLTLDRRPFCTPLPTPLYSLPTPMYPMIPSCGTRSVSHSEKWFLKTNCQTRFKAKYWIIFFVTFRHMGK